MPKTHPPGLMVAAPKVVAEGGTYVPPQALQHGEPARASEGDERLRTAVTITVSGPQVSLTSPMDGATFSAPATIALAADAVQTGAGSISKVEFFQGTTLIGTATAAPYTFNWTNVTTGTYTLTAKATDSQGALAVSNSATVTVNPSVAITSPANGATVNGDSVLVSGTLAGPANAGVTINGVVATVDANRNFHAVVPLAAGSNTLTAKVTTLAGQTATQSIAVTSDGVAPAIQISADRVEGIAPLSVSFKLAGGTPPMQIQVQVTGTATITQPDDTTIVVNYPSPGSYPTTITVTDAEGRTVVRNYVIVAHDAAQLDQRFKGMWADISTRLAAGDVQAALVYFAPESRAQYGTVLNNIAPALASMFSNPPVIHPTNFGAEDYAEYFAIVPHNGRNYGYRFYFMRGSDGLWRLHSL